MKKEELDLRCGELIMWWSFKRRFPVLEQALAQTSSIRKENRRFIVTA
ncbi:hypothetical protein [Bacillus sp. J14TS2]|nr:hypothetical protein [Bacillus sp. J14TS2]